MSDYDTFVEEVHQPNLNRTAWDIHGHEVKLMTEGPKSATEERAEYYLDKVRDAYANTLPVEKIGSTETLDQLQQQFYDLYKNSELGDDITLEAPSPDTMKNVALAENIHDFPLLATACEEFARRLYPSERRGHIVSQIAHEMKHFSRIVGRLNRSSESSKYSVKVGVAFYSESEPPPAPGEYRSSLAPRALWLRIKPLLVAEGTINNLDYLDSLVAPGDVMSKIDILKAEAIKKALVEKGILDTEDDITSEKTIDKLYQLAAQKAKANSDT